MKLQEVKDQLKGKKFTDLLNQTIKIEGVSLSGDDFLIGTANKGIIRVKREDIENFISNLKPIGNTGSGVEFMDCASRKMAKSSINNSGFFAKNERFETIADKMMQIVHGDFTEADVKRADTLCKVSSALVSMEQVVIKANELMHKI